MDIRHRTEIIAGYYSRLKDFQWSEKYSRSDQIVYVRLTDKDGRVKA